MKRKSLVSSVVVALQCAALTGCISRNAALDYFVVSVSASKNIVYYKTGRSGILLEWKNPGSFLVYRHVIARQVPHTDPIEVEITLYGGVPRDGSTTFSNEIAQDDEAAVRVLLDATKIKGSFSLFLKDEERRVPIPFGGVKEVTASFVSFGIE